MSDFWIIFLHTFITKLKTKSFIVTTVIMIVFSLGLTNLSKIMDIFDKDEQQKIAVIDETKELFEPFKSQMKVIDNDLKVFLFEEDEQIAQKEVQSGKLEGFVILAYDKNKLPKGIYKASSIANSTLPVEIQNGLQQVKAMMAAEQLNLSQQQLTKLYEPVVLEKIALEKNAKSEEELNQARGLVYVLLFVIYFSVMMYANMIAMEVATEKTSRVMEILISSVSPIKQMFAKILGVALLSIVQLGAILSIGYWSIKKNLESMEGGFFSFFGFQDIPVSTIVYAIVYFILGYLLYATLAAFLGSLVSRIEDVHQMIMPMTMLVVAGFMIAMFGLGTPEAPFVKVTSYIPFFTPMLMFMRVGMLNIPMWESMLGIGILVITIIIFAIFGAKVYRGGVLMYGKSNNFKDIKKALQLSKKE